MEPRCFMRGKRLERCLAAIDHEKKRKAFAGSSATNGIAHGRAAVLFGFSSRPALARWQMSRTLTLIAFDADDTLWHNERFFQEAQARCFHLLAEFGESAELGQALQAAERRNIPHYGFGIKGFTLSMMEMALAVSGGALAHRHMAGILELGRDMLAHPVELLPGAAETLAALKGRFDLMLITKGDLFDQERKISHSGLADMFGHVEIVSDKTEATYRRLFDRHGQGARRAMMVGNSLKSDVNPALDAGAHAVHVPHGHAWDFEHDAARDGHPRFHAIATLAELPALIDRLEADVE
jgi:putative hydrolase of the HAD superfamily